MNALDTSDPHSSVLLPLHGDHGIAFGRVADEANGRIVNSSFEKKNTLQVLK